MKYFCVGLVILIHSQASRAQTVKDSAWLSKQQIVGTWQRNDSLVGSGLGQNFQLFADNSFVFNIGGEADDVRDIIQLRGRYRLVKDMLYFTITSRKVVEGAIEISDPGISLNIFNIAGSKIMEIPEKDPKELVDPCYITSVSKSHYNTPQY